MTASPNVVRIGNAQAFWGDRCDAAAEMLALEPDLDYLTMDYLAEVSMSILAVQRERDPALGYARDFVEVVASLAPYWSAGGNCRLIVNAGGLNPRGCAEACRAALEEAGCRPMKFAIVTGDDVMTILRGQGVGDRGPGTGDKGKAAGRAETAFRNLDTGAEVSEVIGQLATANAYVGSAPIVAALRGGAEIVITGRVADPALTVAACIHHFGWDEHDWHCLAGATVAGHLIECGTQVTGGISTDWLDLPDPTHIGFPIVEVARDGSCIVTKPNGTTGAVTERTVKEQLLYEIGDPSCYLSPDVTVSFLSLQVKQIGDDRVSVTGAQGRQRPPTLKVSATYRDGYRASGTLTIIGAEALAKAKRCGEIVLQRVQEAGHSLRNSLVECWGDEHSTDNRSQATVLRIAVEADSKAAVERFSRELMPLITSGPPGTTGYAEGRPRVHPVFRYWPCLIDRDAVQPKVEWIESRTATADSVGRMLTFVTSTGTGDRGQGTGGKVTATHYTLRDIAFVRSGDKGTSANIGVLARRPEDFPMLLYGLTAARVKEFFAADGVDAVIRYELPNLFALNFLLKGVLQQSLQTDAQGKALAQRLLAMPLSEFAVNP